MKILFSLLLLLVASSAADAKRHFFEEYGCSVMIPDLRWTVDTSGAEPGLLLHAYMDDQVREVLLFVSEPPSGAMLITDPGVADSIIAGVTGEGELTTRQIHPNNLQVWYQFCFKRTEGRQEGGTSYMLLIRNGYLFTLVSRGRYTDPCTDRGFQTIARSVDIPTSGAIAAEQGMDEALGSPGSESFGERMEEYTRVARNRQVIFGLTMLITLIGLPAYLTYYWLMRRKRLMREAEFEAQLATAPELELARVILNRQEYSLDAVDIAERELARHGRREQMLEDARLRQEAGFDDDESGILLGDAAIRRRVLRGTAMGVISGGVILATIVLRLRNGAAANDPDIVIFSIIGWALVCWALSYSVYRRKLGAALGLIPTLIYLPLWTSVDTGTLSLLPLVLLAIPSVQTVRAIEDGMKKQEQRIDMASVGWEG